MATESWSSRLRHSDNATYQEWRDEFITKLNLLVAAGALAADETDITPAAGARPGTNTEGGYAVYHLDDALHGTAPIYIRFGFGTQNFASAPRIQVTVGTSTNGSGVLGGTALSTIQSCNGTSDQTTDTARQSYFCANEGFFGFNWKAAASSSEGGFFVCRTCDSDGVPTATGALAHWSTGSATTISKRQAFRYAATAAAYTLQTAIANAALGISPQGPANSAIGADVQIFLGWTIDPRATPLFAVCGVYPGEFTAGGTFTATLVGTTPRTYLAWTTAGGPFGPIAANAAGGLAHAMLWE